MAAFLKGLPAVRSKMRRIPDQMRSVLRGASRAGANVFAEYVEENTPSDDVRKAVRRRTTEDDGQVRTTVDLKPGWGRTVGNWMEYGTEAHFISVDASQRGGRSVGRINQLVRAEGGNQSLVIGGQFVGATVWHPGARPHPVFRPARDLRATEAKAAAQAYINAKVKRGVIAPASEGEGE
jgi:hypothetical protein